MIRHRDIVLSPEEAVRFDDDQRENLRSWGIGVPEPVYPDDPDEPPLKPYIIDLTPRLPLYNLGPFTNTQFQGLQSQLPILTMSAQQVYRGPMYTGPALIGVLPKIPRLK